LKHLTFLYLIKKFWAQQHQPFGGDGGSSKQQEHDAVGWNQRQPRRRKKQLPLGNFVDF
jgi:hypothetical protein